jgi:hypothetical protein
MTFSTFLVFHLYMVKVNQSRYRPELAYRVDRGIALPFRDLGARRGWVVSTTPRPLFPPGKTRYPLYRRLGGPQDWPGRVRKIAPPPGYDPRTVQSVASRYTDWTTRPTHLYVDIWEIKNEWMNLTPKWYPFPLSYSCLSMYPQLYCSKFLKIPFNSYSAGCPIIRTLQSLNTVTIHATY